MTPSQREIAGRNGILTVGLILALILLSWLLVWPGYKDLRAEQQNLANTQAIRDERAQSLNDISKLVNTYNSKKKELTVIFERALPQSPQVPQLLSDLEQFSEQSQMPISSIKITEVAEPGVQPATEETPPSVEKVFTMPKLVKEKIEVSILGPYTSFPLFLELVEKNLRVFDIQQVNSEGSPSGANEVPKFNLTIYTDYQE